MKRIVPLLAILTSPALTPGQATPETPRLLEVRKIWDQAPHNAFTDLIRFHDRWFCAFREGQAHVSPDGALRVLTSEDGRAWTSAARVASPTSDLRDAKLSITPDGRLMLLAAAALRPPAVGKHQTMAWFSRDGFAWDESGTPVGDRDVWLWRVTWNDGNAYGVGYGTAAGKFVRLYKSADGARFEALVPTLYDQGFPNEASLLFRGDDSALCLLRQDATKTSSGLLGRAKPPYTNWSWTDLGVKVGGPAVVALPDGRIVAGVRLYDGKVRTALCWLDPEAGKLAEFLPLPSGGDTSYPGLVWHSGKLWVSYYSSHEGKTNIYLAEVAIPPKSEKISGPVPGPANTTGPVATK